MSVSSSAGVSQRSDFAAAALGEAESAQAGGSTQRRRRIRSVGRSLWWFVLPAAAVYVYVVVVPTVQGMFSAFTEWSFSTPQTFTGLDNFVRIFQTDAGPAALRTLFIALVVVVAQNILGLGLALLLNGRVLGRNILRTIIFAPMVVSSLVVGYLFQYLFGPPGIGGVNVALNALGMQQVDFLGNPTSALWIIIVTIVWQFTGSTMVIYLAGLQGVPQELEEAAALDGAGFWKRFWYVVRPLLAPAITINLMLSIIGGIKLFDQVYATTGGGPANSTETLSTLIYRFAFNSGQFSFAIAIAVVLTILVSIFAFAQYAILRRGERRAS